MNRIFSVAMLVGAFTAVAFLPALAADTKEPKDPKEATSVFMGKISKVDSGKHELTLTDVRVDGDKAPAADKNPTAEKDKGTTEKTAGTYTVSVSEKAKITLDGSKAELKDLEKGNFCRVWAAKADKTTGDKATDEKTGEKTADKDDTTHLKTERIEAFTKAPPTKDPKGDK